MSADKHNVSMALGHASGDGANTNFRNQFHVDPGVGVDVFQVMYQLCQVFNGINIMVGRRRDQFNPRCGLTHPSNIFINLMAGQLSTLAGLGTLGHLNLEVGSIDQIVGSYTEPTGGDLFNGAAARITVLVQPVTPVVFSTLTGVAARRHSVHGDGHHFVGFSAD